MAGVLDDLFAYDGPLGANVINDGVKFDVWAPTAQVIFRSIMKLLAVWIHLKLGHETFLWFPLVHTYI